VRAGEALGLLASPRLWDLSRRVTPGAGFFLLAVPQSLAAQARRVNLDPALRGGVLGLTGLLLEGLAGQELTLRAVAFGEDAESVRILGDLARGGLALLRLATGAAADVPPEVQSLLTGLVVKAEARALAFELSLPRGLLAQLSTH
jgi:hypothetical protein